MSQLSCGQDDWYDSFLQYMITHIVLLLTSLHFQRRRKKSIYATCSLNNVGGEQAGMLEWHPGVAIVLLQISAANWHSLEHREIDRKTLLS